MTLYELAEALRSSRGFAHKRDIESVVGTLAHTLPNGASDLAAAIPVGDDCAAIRDGDGYLLFAIEGFVNEFVAAEPWFAGYCGVMVNTSDVAAMGGRPTAVVDAIWSAGGELATPILQGLAAASATYGVPIVGGHSNSRSDRQQLSVAIVGRARRLLTSFDAQPGDRLLAAIDLRGRYREPYPYWDASTCAPVQRLRSDLDLLPALAESGLCRAAKDISMAGTVGTAMMLLECSGLGAVIDVTAVPRPPSAPLARWLTAFPSFGFVLAVAPQHVQSATAHFIEHDIACAEIGRTDESGRVRLSDGTAEVPLWDFQSTPLIGCGGRFTKSANMSPELGCAPSRPLKIGLLAHSTNPRGGVIHALELGEAMQAAGHDVTVHAPSVRGAGFFRPTRCKTALVPAAAATGGLADLIAQRIDEYVAYFERTGTEQYDVLHAQDSISANALADLRGRGLVRGFLRTVHHLDRFEDPRLMAWQTQGVVCADQVLCVSRLWVDGLRRAYNIDAMQVANGVDTRRFNSTVDESDARVLSRYGLQRGAPILLAIGGVEARKNTLRLFEAFVRIRRTHPDAQLIIAGGVSLLDHSIYRAQFDAAVRASGLVAGPGKPVVLAGAIADDEMPALYRCADVLVFPSLKEGFGLVVLEAMASGTPVVTSRIAPFTEYLRDGDVSWAQPLDVDSIAAAIRFALRLQAAGALREAGERVTRRFTWAASAQKHLTVYAEWMAHEHA